jgi:predicted lactoylglutathione lyase
MDQRVSMIMIGAQDVPKLRSFYEEGLGWSPWSGAKSGSAMYKVGHSVIVFLNGDYLAQERGEPLSQGSKASLAVFVDSKTKVDEMYQRAIAAGARQTSGVRDRDGGLYTGYFTDPEGNSWEVVWAPDRSFDADGALTDS